MFGVDTPWCELMESRLRLHVKAVVLACMRTRKVGRGKKKEEDRKLFNLLCIQRVDDEHNNTPVIFKTVPAAVWLFLC